MKTLLFISLLVLSNGCAHLNQNSLNRNVASELKPFDGGFFQFGIHKGKATVAGYSVRSCDIFVPSLTSEMSVRLEKELSAKGYKVRFQNELFTQGMSIYGFTSVVEKKELHNNEKISGSLFLRIAETKAKNQFDADMREAAIGIFGEDGFEIVHTYVPLSNKTEYLRISKFPSCFE